MDLFPLFPSSFVSLGKEIVPLRVLVGKKMRDFKARAFCNVHPVLVALTVPTGSEAL